MTQIKSNIPKIRFREFSGEWEEKQLGELGELLTGLTYSPSDIKKEGLLVLRSSNIKNNGIKYDDTVYVDLLVNEKLITKHNDLLICIRNGSKRLIGKNILIPKNIPHSTHGAFMSVFRSDNNLFIYQLFQTKEYYKNIHKDLGATINSINGNNFKKYKFNFPQFPEQQKIALFLSLVDEKIENIKEKKKSLEEYKKGVIQKIFSRKIRFKDENGESFGEWEENKLGEICEINKGNQLNKDNLTETGLYPALNGGINPSGYTEKYNKLENTITISEGGNSCGYINFTKTKFWCGGHCYALEKLECNVLYLFQILKFSEDNIMRLRVGSGLPNIQKKEINNFKISISSLQEQEKIADFLSGIDEKIESIGSELESVEEFKKGVLQGIFV